MELNQIKMAIFVLQDIIMIILYFLVNLLLCHKILKYLFMIFLGNKYLYLVYNIYEVEESDLSPIFDYQENEKTLTLVTCNNLNSNRIILKAKQKKL